jgi:hypothetical protein
MSTVNRKLIYFFGREIDPRDDLVQEMQTRQIFGANFPDLSRLRDIVISNKPGAIIVNADAFDETQLRSTINKDFLSSIQDFCVTIVMSKQSGGTAYRTLWYIGGATLVVLPDVASLELISFLSARHDTLEGIASYDFNFTLSTTSINVRRGQNVQLVGRVANVLGPARRIDWFLSGTSQANGLNASWNPSFCTVDCQTVFTISARTDAPLGLVVLTAIAGDISSGRDVRKTVALNVTVLNIISELISQNRLSFADNGVSLKTNDTPCGC